jgi:ATP diphosphatase
VIRDRETADSMAELLDIMQRLRDPQSGCPWDKQQDHRSIARYAIEEAYEMVDSIERGDINELRDELGDLLFQVVFHAQMASEAGVFELRDVVRSICEKLRRRHPHVFGGEKIADADQQTLAWEAHKEAERRARDKGGLLEGVPLSLPAITRAVKLQKRAARVGFDWEDAKGVIAKIEEELQELAAAMSDKTSAHAIEAELGDVLFSCVNLARKLNVDPETALRAVNRRFERRVDYMETRARERSGRLAELSLGELEVLWEEAKSRGL